MADTEIDLTSVGEGVLTAEERSKGEVALDGNLQYEFELWGVR